MFETTPSPRRITPFQGSKLDICKAVDMAPMRLRSLLFLGWQWVEPVHRISCPSPQEDGRKMWGSMEMLLSFFSLRSAVEPARREPPVLYLQREHDRVVVASNAGRHRNPTWYFNLKANPEEQIQMRDQIRRVRAREAAAEERNHLWPLLTTMFPNYGGYQTKTKRLIPIMILEERQQVDSERA